MRAKQSCLRSLARAHNVHGTELHPRAAVAAPNFIYTPPKRRLVATQPTWWITHWKFLGPTPNDWKAWQATQINIMVRAVELGGFKGGEVEVYPAAELASIAKDSPYSEAMVIDFSACGVSLWRKEGNNFFHSFPASYWKDVVSKGLREHRQRGSGGIILAGSGWTSWRLRSLYRIVSDSGLDIAVQNSRDPIFAPSRGAAKHANRTESVFL